MDKKTNLELYYILPYTKKYNAGHHFYNDEICCSDYKDSSFSTWYGNSLFFETEKELLNYFYQNPHNPTPEVYRIQYIGHFKGLDDVIQITELRNNSSGFYTILNKDSFAWFSFKVSEFCGKYVWQDTIFPIEESRFILKDIYKEFHKRGIKFKYDVLKKNIDKSKWFEFVGNPYCIVDAIQMKDKQLILYRYNPKQLRKYEEEELLKQYLSEEEIYRLLYELENPLQEIFFGKKEPVEEQSGLILTKKPTTSKNTGNK